MAILKGPQVAFASPILTLSSVENEMVEILENQSFSLEDWQLMFLASNQGEGILMSVQDIKQEVKVSKDSDSFRTPAKKKKVLTFEPETAFERYSASFESSQERSAYRYMKAATSASLADSVVDLNRSLLALSKGVEKCWLAQHL